MNYGVYLHVFHGVPVDGVSLLLVFPCRWCFPVVTVDMSLYDYFKAFDGLPDPKGSLSRSVSFAAIASASQVEHAESDRRWALAHWLPRISVCQVPPKVGSHGGPSCKDLFHSRPLDPRDCMYERASSIWSPRVHGTGIKDRPFSGCTKSLSHFRAVGRKCQPIRPKNHTLWCTQF